MSNENVHRDEFDLQFNKISGIKWIVFVNNLILCHGIKRPVLFSSYRLLISIILHDRSRTSVKLLTPSLFLNLVLSLT